MLRSYNFEQAAEKLALDDSELKFLVHHFWEFFSRSGADQQNRLFSSSDISLLERVVQLQRGERLDVGVIRHKLRQEVCPTYLAGTRQAEFLAFCSGRPGGGISTLVWNLAAALASRGARCTIFDASFEQSSLESLIPGETESGEWCRVLDTGVRLISGAKILAAGENFESLNDETVQELRLLDSASDFVLIDSGLGCSDTALRFAMLVDETVMLTTADVGENADCFSVVRMLRDVDPDLPLGLVINRAASLDQAREAFARINGAGSKLGLSDTPGLGWVIEDEALRRCRATGEAVVEALPNSPSARCISRLAENMSNRLKPAERRNHGGLRDIVRTLATAMQRGALVKDVY